MQPARTRPPRRDLYIRLIDLLARTYLGATIRYSPLGKDAHWCATSRTLTLRADADEHTHLEIVRDLIDVTLGHPSQLGATPTRHLTAVS